MKVVRGRKHGHGQQKAVDNMKDVKGNLTDTAIVKTLETQIQGNVALDTEHQQAINKIAEAIGGMYFAIFHIKMSTDVAICFRNTNKDISKMIKEKSQYSVGWQVYVEHFIEEAYKPEMREFGDFATLGERLLHVNMIAHIYRMYAMKWTRVQFIVASRDAEGRADDVIMAISDANDEMKLEEQRQQAIFEAEHDVLTGLYNRKGLERIIQKDEFKNGKIGFMLLDVDNFKALNDNYGHDMGDKVLSAIARQLKQVFRGEDRIFRLGGDEIALLLHNCDDRAWNVICHKLSSVHASLAEVFADVSDMSVTLSVGLCFSEMGYYDGLYMLADEALYATKQNGRAGCTLIDTEHGIRKQWADHATTFHASHELGARDSGMFRMEIPADPKEPRRIICGEVVRAAFGANITSTPEECYRIWEDGVLPEYKATLHEAMLAMVSEGHAECTYLWNHPQWGVIYVRSNGFGEVKNGMVVLTGMHYLLRDTKLIEKKNSFELINAALLYALKTNHQYIFEYDPVLHISTSFSSEDAENHVYEIMHDFPECMRQNDLIHPEDVEKYIACVHEMDEGADSAHCNIRSVRNGEVRWESCDFHAFYNSDKGYKVAIIIVLDITDRMASLQDYHERVEHLGMINQESLSAGFISVTNDTYKCICIEKGVDKYLTDGIGFEKLMLDSTAGIIGEESRKKFKRLFARDNLLRLAEAGQTKVEMDYLYRLNDNHVQWLEAVVEMVKNPLTGEIGGVVYSRSVQKERLSSMILEKTRNLLYPKMAIVVADTDEYYLLNQEQGDYSDAAQDFWGVLLAELDHYVVDMTHEELAKLVNKENVLAQLEEKGEATFVYNTMSDGELHRFQSRFVYLEDTHSLILSYGRNITDTALIEKYRFESEHDSLTGLLNRNAVFGKCRQLLDEYPEERMMMLHVDVKHFHLYNTFFGEAAGDQLLCKLADIFREVLQDYEHVAYGRIESDVFCVMLPVKKDMLKQNIKQCLKELNLYTPNFPLRLAIGAYEITDASLPIESMFSRATIAAKANKQNMLNLLTRFDSKMESELEANQQITSEIKTALEEEQFEVYLQPKFALRSEKIVGAEALVRWNHPKRGMISPGLFIPAFEQNGQIFLLDAYMWEHTCKLLRRWQDEGRPMYPVSINVSRVSMYSRGTVPYLKLLVEKYCLDPKYLELELTETAYMDDPEDLKRMLKELQDYGFKILMDDFGSGYSSLNTLRELPVDVLKLDMKFLSVAEADRRGLAVLSSVVRMSKLLNLPIIAEGVEKRDQADYLRSIGCEYVQGYLFGRPMPVAEYEKLLDAGEGESKESCPIVRKASFATAEVVIEDPLVSLGILEYDKEHFAYLRTNKKFLSEFDLVEDLRPASKVFREHLDEENYKVLLHAFADCSLTMEDVFFVLEWTGDDGVKQRYHGYVHYHGMIGTYADLSVTFVNVTNMKKYGEF